jgi:hypothetical protein
MAVKLADDECIVATAAEYHAGPGWANATLTVVVRDSSSKLRLVVLQPHEMSAQVSQLFNVAAAVHRGVAGALIVDELEIDVPKPKRRKR